ncbi:MAG: AMP-dependent synthetase/ligase [Actinomycetes bacterium]
MTEYRVPAVFEVPPRGSLADLVPRNAEQAPDAAVFSRKVGGHWRDVTARVFADEVDALAKGLLAAGVGLGDRVGLISATRYEWTLADFAIWAAGAVTVPVYETSSAEQVAWILGDSGAVACVVETAGHEARLDSVRADLDGLREVWAIESGGLDALAEAGQSVSDADLAARREGLRPDSPATLIYTSGTTGRPKGCVLTHGNFLAELGNVTTEVDGLFDEGHSSTLLFLPLAHVLARIIQVGCVMTRTRMGHTADVAHLLDDFAGFRPTFLLSVPRVFEKVYNSSAQQAEAAGKGRAFQSAASTAIAYSEALDAGGPGLLLRARHALFDRLVYRKLRDALGGQVEYAVSGGAPLGARLGHFFRGVGVVVLEGYGLTETTGAHTVNRPDQLRIGTVGRPIAGSAVKIAEDGEVLVRGGNVFGGYWGGEGVDAETLSSDGWFGTGDLGELDGDGFLTITGRKKEVIVTAGGKNVVPAVLEDRIRAHPLVSQCMVVGDGRPYVAALVTLDAEALPGWLRARGKDTEATLAQLAEDEDVHREVEAAVEEANRAVSRAEAVRRFRVLAVDFTEEGGQLTPTMKLRRNVVLKEFSAEVEALFG